MLHILLVLKWIGNVILVLLGVVLLLAGVVLFMPIRYKVHGETEEGVEKLVVNARASWILGLARARVSYSEGQKDIKVRILWIDPMKKKSEEKQEKDKEKKSVAASETSSEVQETKTDEQVDRKKGRKASDGKNVSSGEEKPAEKKKWFHKISYTIKSKYDKIKKIKNARNKFHEFITDERNQVALSHVVSEVKVLLKHISPRKMKGHVRFGFDDPYATGQVLAGLSVLYPFYKDEFLVFPDFEKKVLEGCVDAKGRIRIFPVVISLWHLYSDKNVRRAYEKIRRK